MINVQHSPGPAEDQTSGSPSWADPDRVDDRLHRLHEHAEANARGAAVELYSRTATTMRLSRLPSGRAETLVGGEEGFAVRIVSRNGEVGFASSSGATRQSLDWTLARALEGRRPAREGECGWQSTPTGPLTDRDPIELPPIGELAEWLRAAWERATPGPAGRGTPSPVAGWIEVAATIESWVATGGLCASRTRLRAWAGVELSSPEGSARPVLVARATLGELAESAWAEVLEDRWTPPGLAERLPTSRISAVFSPECAAALVLAVVRARQAPGQRPDLPVGRGWEIVDDPRQPRALFGGTFDDGGFETGRTRLADGQRWAGALAGAGHLRRPSFRDPPVPQMSHLAVVPRAADPPTRCLLISGMTLHALEPERWLLQLDAAVMEDGRPGARVHGAVIRTSPLELAERCVATIGPTRTSHLGVATPALLFDGLELA